MNYFYQLAFVTPGIKPEDAISLNVTLDIPLSGISKSTTIRKRVRLPEGITSTFAGDPVVDVTITVREN